MSFSGEVKEELAKHTAPARHCQIAELTAILAFCGSRSEAQDSGEELVIRTENVAVIRKCFTLLRKTFNIDTDVLEKAAENPPKSGIYQFSLGQDEKSRRVLEACKRKSGTVSPILLKNTCCRRAFLRGAYLAVGSMSDPQRSYHLEFVCTDEAQARQLCEILSGFGLEAKTIRRKKYHVVYMKEGSCIADLLNIAEAHVALMALENARIVKDIRGSINRRVNCEAANIVKTVNAAGRQVADIRLIQEKRGLSSLPENLRETAELRLAHPQAALHELCELMNPPVGKSGMNHRLRKLSRIAQEIRESIS